MENYWRSVDHARIYLKVSVQFVRALLTQTHHENNAPQLLLAEINVKNTSVDACIARTKCNHTCNLFWHEQTTSRNNRQDELWSAVAV